MLTKLLRVLGLNVAVLSRSSTDIFVRYSVPGKYKWMVTKLIYWVKQDDRHPNLIRPLLAVRTLDGGVELDAEYGDAGPLSRRISYFPPNDRIVLAKSVARQVLSALLYMGIVHGTPH